MAILRDAHLRHAEYYFRIVSEMTRLYEQRDEAFRCALTVFDLELNNIRTAQRWLSENVSVERKAVALCSNYADIGATLVDLRLHPTERLRWYEAALASARDLKDRAAEGRHLGNLGVVYLPLGETHRAIEFFEQQLVL